MKRRISVVAIALMFSVLSVSAQTGTWTAVGSSGVVDETSFPHAFTQTRLGFNPNAGSSAGRIIARYNVTNTFGGGFDDTPPWTTLEVGAVRTSLDTVTARLFRVNPCTGVQTLICTAVNSSAGSTGTCASCTFPSNSFNFATNLYYVEVTIDRITGTGSPELTTLRIR